MGRQEPTESDYQSGHQKTVHHGVCSTGGKETLFRRFHLVPKLCLGTHLSKLRFASAAPGRRVTGSGASRLAVPSGAWDRGEPTNYSPPPAVVTDAAGDSGWASKRWDSFRRKSASLNGSKLMSCQRTRPRPSMRNVPCNGTFSKSSNARYALKTSCCGLETSGKANWPSLKFLSDVCRPFRSSLLMAMSERPAAAKSLAFPAKTWSCSAQCRQPDPR